MIKPLSAHTLNLSAKGDLMQRTFRFLEIALISLALAACVVLYTVGLHHADLGYERRWTYPVIFALLPAFCIRACLRYVLKQKNQNPRV